MPALGFPFVGSNVKLIPPWHFARSNPCDLDYSVWSLPLEAGHYAITVKES